MSLLYYNCAVTIQYALEELTDSSTVYEVQIKPKH